MTPNDDVCGSLTSVEAPTSEVLHSILWFLVLLCFSAAPAVPAALQKT